MPTIAQTQLTSLDKALMLLEALGSLGRAGIKDLSASTGLPPSTVHRLLAVLARGSYVRQDPGGRKYHLSFKLLELGAKAREDLDLVAVAQPVMRRLMEQSGETVNLVVFDHSEVVYVAQEASTRSMLRMFTRVGGRAPLYCSGVGKSYLAWQGDQVALEYFRQTKITCHTRRTIVSPDALLKEMAAIRERGYSIDDEEMEEGVRCVSCLIFQAGRAVAGGMSISGPAARLTKERLPELAGFLTDAAGEISAELGHRQY